MWAAYLWQSLIYLPRNLIEAMKALTIQSYIWISYECGLVFVSIYRNRKSATSRSYSMFLRTAQVTGTHLVPSEFRTPQRNNILDILWIAILIDSIPLLIKQFFPLLLNTHYSHFPNRTRDHCRIGRVEVGCINNKQFKSLPPNSLLNLPWATLQPSAVGGFCSLDDGHIIAQIASGRHKNNLTHTHTGIPPIHKHCSCS
jgi:hypothetical protein